MAPAEDDQPMGPDEASVDSGGETGAGSRAVDATPPGDVSPAAGHSDSQLPLALAPAGDPPAQQRPALEELLVLPCVSVLDGSGQAPGSMVSQPCPDDDNLKAPSNLPPDKQDSDPGGASPAKRTGSDDSADCNREIVAQQMPVQSVAVEGAPGVADPQCHSAANTRPDEAATGAASPIGDPPEVDEEDEVARGGGDMDVEVGVVASTRKTDTPGFVSISPTSG
jgi:hypothetical protein